MMPWPPATAGGTGTRRHYRLSRRRLELCRALCRQRQLGQSCAASHVAANECSLVQEKKFLELPAMRGRDARTPSSSLVAQDSAEHGGYCDRCSNAYENHGQLRVSMTAVVVYALHVRVTKGCGCVGPAIAHDK